MKLLKFGNNEELDLSSTSKEIKVKPIDFYPFIVELFNKLTENNGGIMPVFAQFILTIALQWCRGNGNNSILMCSDNRPVDECEEEEVNILAIATAITKENIIQRGFGKYPIGLFHLLCSPPTHSILSKTQTEKFNNDESAISTEILQMLPSMSISGNAEKSKINGYSWSYQEKNSKSTYKKTHSAILGRLSVTADTKLKIGKISISMTGYQPRKGEYNKTNPNLHIYWRYVGKYTNSDKHEIGNFNSSNTSETNKQYNNRQCTWVGAVNETKVKEFDIVENGDIEIVAYFSADCTGKQLWDYPYISFSTSVFECETTSSFNAANNTITITKSGIIIKTPDGGTLSTVGGELAMLSENLKYGLKISNDGVEICKDGSWSKL